MTSEDTDGGFDLQGLELKVYTGFLMKHAFNAIVGDLAQVLAPYGLRKLSFSALKVVVQYPGISQSQLAQALAMERSNIVSLLDGLEADGLLARTPVPTNRRAHALQPTARGMALAAEVSREVTAHEARLFAQLPPEDLAATRRVLLVISGL